MNLIQILTNENPVIINILAFIVSALEGLLFCNFFSILLNIKPTKKQKYIFMAIISITGGISNLLENNIINDLINLLPFLLSLHLLFHQNIKNSFLALVCTYLCSFISEYISGNILMFLLKCKFSDFVTIPLNYILSIVLIYGIFIILTILFKNIKHKKMQMFSIKNTIIVNLILGIFMMIFESYLLSVYRDSIPFRLTLAILIISLIYFSISMYSIVRTNALEKTKEDLENEKLYNKTLTLLHDNIRCFKHDFNNIVQAIGGYISLNDMDGLKKYYNNLLEECTITNNLNVLNPETINNPSVYSLLTNKYYLATQKNIKMTFSIFADLSKIDSNMYELSRILGILLDNAIEAAEESNEKIIEIELKSDQKKILFTISNSCKDSNISTTKIFEKGYSTKNRNSGIGLWKVHKILSKNTKLDLFTTVNENMFSQQLSIYY
ncbi:MAG: GHKL domain-containing protein [Clostridia bacterium]|nr:GHKL domain-containing protein [Clostridia bacterium]